MPSLQLPDSKVSMTLGELATIQSIAAAHITFSVTLACPLRCAHCIVSAAPELGKTTMPLRVAEHYAAQMPELAEYGIRSISFTGGEPLVAPRQLEVLANAAKAAGISSGVVTAAHWATSPDRARDVVGRFRAIGCWDLSVDVYHQPYVGLENVRRAYDAAIAEERRVTIRLTHHEPPTAEEQEILDFIATLPEAAFSCQRVRAVGRGAELPLGTSYVHNPWVKPCLTQGLVVRYDGSISPCCLNLVEERQHAFQLGDARARPLVEIHREYMALPLLHLIRAVGFADVMAWLDEAGLRDRLPERLPDEVCEICALLMRDQTVIDVLVERASQAEMQLKIAVTASRVLGEHQMLRSVLARFADRRADVPEYELAEQWLNRVTAA